MKVIAVVGSASGTGKTALACRILAAFPGRLAAVKISPRDEPARVEWGPGTPGKDTARYAASGALRVARIVAPRGAARAAWEAIRGEFGACAGVVVEGAGALDLEERTLVVAVVGGEHEDERPERTRRLVASADVVVATSPAAAAGASRRGDALDRLRPGALLLSCAPEPTADQTAGLVRAAGAFLAS